MKKLVAAMIVIATVLMSACSTLSFIPTEGGASKFNLATVEYVQAQNAAQQEELISHLSDNIAAQLDSLLEEDRAAIEDLAVLLDSLENSIGDLTARLDTSEMNLERSLSGMSKELTTVKTNASSTRMVIRRINDGIDKLPVKALETFNQAINEYLAKQQEAETVSE
jgi:hypothetical protein